MGTNPKHVAEMAFEPFLEHVFFIGFVCTNLETCCIIINVSDFLKRFQEIKTIFGQSGNLFFLFC